jgi:hypothetical protein
MDKKTGTAFENISQRVVFSHLRQLSDHGPVLPEGLSPSEQRDMRASQQELYGFFRAFYQCAYDHPEAFGLPLTEDVYVREGDGKETKNEVSKQIKKVRVKMAYGIDFLYLAGEQGVLVNGHLRLKEEDYASFLTKSPRVKQKLLKGMEEAGMTLSEGDDGVLVGNTRYPNMMLALQALAQACALNDDDRMTRFLFARCDFCALEPDYRLDVLDLLRTALPPSEHERAVALHRALAEMAYMPALGVGGYFDWRIQYQGKRAIKSTPLFEFEYDERLRRQFVMRIKCASTNRLVPLVAQRPPSLQRDFYDHANTCGGASCGWCKTRKGMGPSVLEHNGHKKTICWYMQRRFYEVDGEAVDLVKQYALLHEALVGA